MPLASGWVKLRVRVVRVVLSKLREFSVGAGSSLTLIVNCCVLVWLPTVAVKVRVMGVPIVAPCALPDSTPVEGSKLRPEGKLPAVMASVAAWVPICAATGIDPCTP